MSWEDYSYIAHGYFVRQAREWERTRYLAMWIINMGDSKTKIKDVRQLLPLITDEKEAPLSEEELKLRKQRALLGLQKLNKHLSGNGL